MANVTDQAEAAVNMWPIVESLDLEVLGLPSLNDVHYVCRDASSRFDQVLIGTGRFNALLVVVVDLAKRSVHGHRVLDLNEEYDVTGGHLRWVR